MSLEYPDPHERKREQARLIGVEGRMLVEVEGHARSYAIADEDLGRENEEKTSSEHFLRFEFSPATRQSLLAGARVKLGCDHGNDPPMWRSPRRLWRRWWGSEGLRGWCLPRQLSAAIKRLGWGGLVSSRNGPMSATACGRSDPPLNGTQPM